jgi:Ca-activated chloride channel family protein
MTNSARGGLALAGLCVLGLGFSGQVSAAQAGAIEGLVRAGGAPVQAASVGLAGPVVRVAATDGRGAFRLVDLAAGAYTLTVGKPGFQTLTRKVSLGAGQTVRIELELVPSAPAADKRTDAPRAAVSLDEPEVFPAAESRKVKSDRRPAAEPAPLAAPVASSPAPVDGLVGGRGGLGTRGGDEVSGRSRPAYASPPPPAKPVRARIATGPAPDRVSSGDQFVSAGLNLWTEAAQDPLSTFAVDVDTGAYTVARRRLREGGLPPPAAVRVEEFVNYFHYDYPAPRDMPFRVDLEAAPSPFEKNLMILRVGLKGKEAVGQDRKPLHLTFLVDTSGSMSRADRLPLAKRSLRYLVDQLAEGDTVALTTYAGSVREVLRPTGMRERARIHEAIESLGAGGSTAMGSGLELAYRQAWDNFKQGHENRVIVLSDGDANVGRTSHGDMLTSIAWYAQRGVTLSAIGFGRGNYKDHRMEQLANKGNGNYYYIDSFSEAKRVFGDKLTGTLQVIAKDVKIQVEFPARAVKKYRLVGYENRAIDDRDFRNDKVDAGEIGAGHTVTALYEVEVTNPRTAWAIARVRWKAPDGDRADEREFALEESMARESFQRASAATKRAVAAAALAENLRQSPFRESWTMQKARELAQASLSRESPEELELLELIDRAARLMR